MNCTCIICTVLLWLIPHPTVIWLTYGSMECNKDACIMYGILLIRASLILLWQSCLYVDPFPRRDDTVKFSNYMAQDICLYSIYHKSIQKVIKVCCEMLQHIQTCSWISVAHGVQGSAIVHIALAKCKYRYKTDQITCKKKTWNVSISKFISRLHQGISCDKGKW
jgi:hypothetical protein